MAARPFTSFNFKILLEAEPGQVLCDAEFSDCDGLEMNMEPKTIREGGNNGRQIHLAGPVSYGEQGSHFAVVDTMSPPSAATIASGPKNSATSRAKRSGCTGDSSLAAAASAASPTGMPSMGERAAPDCQRFVLSSAAARAASASR